MFQGSSQNVGAVGTEASKAIAATMFSLCSLMTLEVIAMGLKAGLALSPMLEAINGSSGRSRFTEQRLAGLGGHCPGFEGPLLSELAEGVRHAIRLSGQYRVGMPLASIANGLLAAGINRFGADGRLDSMLAVIASMADLGNEAYPRAEQAVLSQSVEGARKPTIGYVGLGAMGSALARRARTAADRLFVFDVVKERMAEQVQEGAVAAADMEALARESDVIMLCVPTSEHVKDILLGEGGMLKGLSPGKVVIDQTTGSPSDARSLSQTLHQMGVGFVDAPVAGGPGSADNGTLLALCGGAQEDFQKVYGLLQTMGRSIYFGASGSGQTAKLVKNATGACNRFICYEIIALAQRTGISLADLLEQTKGTDAWTAALQRIADAERTGVPTAIITSQLFYKDLRLVSELAASFGSPMFIANAVRSRVEALIREVGPEANIDELGRAYGLSRK
ncbi:NAD(P)-binding domain-containing protein [Cupriavidus sp. CV2]|uniref:NAD(P)-binding domain-containing protein n=1 Tax=Cupriavidus ulmosensis TaxID=3065913 RepID=UPI00296ADE18|nr:NAD(P)-binding domain-containing protein [Cupriavidus sp. CV2]MDW3682792.1 NAD(P)-binding domain-containing protein [Cupriavidus sp. CV2]